MSDEKKCSNFPPSLPLRDACMLRGGFMHPVKMTLKEGFVFLDGLKFGNLISHSVEHRIVKVLRISNNPFFNGTKRTITY